MTEQVLAWMHDHLDGLVGLTAALAEMETPSVDPISHEPAFEMLSDALTDAGMRAMRIPGDRTGGSLYARPRRRVRQRPWQVLAGHMDTVWPAGTVARRPVRVDDGRLVGPGVYDMKAGLAQMVFALRAVHDLGLEPLVTPVVLVNSDEEIGSAESTRLLERLGRHADRALVLEPSLGPSGRIKTARKGVGRFVVTLRGRAAHAGLDPDRGRSAILELSHQIQRLFALNDPERGVTVNVGMIDGGMRPNVVAPTSRAVVDVRVPTHADAERVEAAIRGLEPVDPDIRVEVEGRFGRPPMEPGPGARKLWQLARRLGEGLGLDLQETTAGGGSDGNTLAAFTPTLDGLGAVGDGAHAEHEFVFLDRMAERAALLALLVLAPALEGSP